MSRNIVISFQKLGGGTYEMPSLKIAKFLSQEFNAAVVDSPESAADELYREGVYSNLFVVSGMYQFCKFRDLAVAVCKRAISKGATPFFCCNDYTTKIPKGISEALGPELVHLSNGEYGPNHVLVNWNALSFARNPQAWSRAPVSPTTMVYFGAHREGRAHAFKKFLSGRAFQTVISTSQKNFDDHFRKYGPVALDPCKNLDALGRKYGFTVYICDKVNEGKMWVFPANRFYEAMSVGLYQFIDRSALYSFTKAEAAALEPFVVIDAMDVWQRIADLPYLRALQGKMVASVPDYRAEMTSRLHEVVLQFQKKVGGA